MFPVRFPVTGYPLPVPVRFRSGPGPVRVRSGSGPGPVRDVTIHSASAQSCQNFHCSPRCACAAAERATHARYGPSVLPLAFETCGRLGPRVFGHSGLFAAGGHGFRHVAVRCQVDVQRLVQRAGDDRGLSACRRGPYLSWAGCAEVHCLAGEMRRPLEWLGPLLSFPRMYSYFQVASEPIKETSNQLTISIFGA